MSELDPVVHVIDDDEAFLIAVSRLLRASRLRVRTFTSATAFLESLSPQTNGCVISDLQMPGMNGLELQAELARRDVTIPVIFLSGCGNVSSAVRAMHAGADDFLEKLSPQEDLMAAVTRALARQARDRETSIQKQKLLLRFKSITERERQVLREVVRGRLNKQIAADMGISERTVKVHRAALTTKLGVPSVAELTKLTLEAEFFSKPGIDCP